eukprot:1778384-Amphidinium_carterae.1
MKDATELLESLKPNPEVLKKEVIMKKRKHETEELSIHSVELFHKQETHIKKLKEKYEDLSSR